MKGTRFAYLIEFDDENSLASVSSGCLGLGAANGKLQVKTPANDVYNILGADTAAVNGEHFYLNNGILSRSTIYESTGNIGIGTVTPRFKLDVAGIINASNSVLSDLGTFGSSLQANGLTGMIASGVENDESITFYTCDQPRVVIDKDGNLGIGTDEPETPLHILSGGLSSIQQRISNNAGGAGLQFWKARGSFVSPAIVVANDVAGGIAGFGFDGANYISLTNFTSSVGASPGVGQMSGYFIWFTRHEGVGLTERMRLTSDGKLGIGTTSPDYTLHCIGDISGSAYRVGSTPGIDMASGTPTCVVINKGIVTAATRVIPIADGNYRISDGDTITTVGGIITAIS
jgi:hypothetical protein